MRGRKLIALFVMILLSHYLHAQQVSYEEADIKSYDLYQKGEWKELLRYGKEYTAAAPDFVLLRLRMGYAAFMLGNFSEALQQYDAVMKKDSYNETAHYYSWLCRRYCNQYEQADAETKYFSKELMGKEKLPSFAITKVGTEISYKNTLLKIRGNGMYARGDVNMRVAPGINMQHSFCLYNQTIAERKLSAVTNNDAIAINQKEYYNKTTINLNRQWQLVGAWHYLRTPFNNFVYSNQLALAGVRYNSYYFSLQADAVFGKLTDTSLQQYNFQLSVFPLGNLNVYSISTASLRTRNGQSNFNVKQVIGAKLLKFLWAEGNITAGRFSNFTENDALYVYNAIDPNKIKAGITCYAAISPAVTAQLGYTLENRELYLSPNTFYQHSITGGISCRF